MSKGKLSDKNIFSDLKRPIGDITYRQLPFNEDTIEQNGGTFRFDDAIVRLDVGSFFQTTME